MNKNPRTYPHIFWIIFAREVAFTPVELKSPPIQLAYTVQYSDIVSQGGAPLTLMLAVFKCMITNLGL